MGACPTSPVNSLHVESSVLPLTSHRNSCVLESYFPPSLPYPNFHLCYRIQNILPLINCPNIQPMSAFISFFMSPWIPIQFTTNSAPHEAISNNIRADSYTLSKELLEKYEIYPKCFTDGSEFSSYVGCSVIHTDTCPYLTFLFLPLFPFLPPNFTPSYQSGTPLINSSFQNSKKPTNSQCYLHSLSVGPSL